MGLLNTQMVEQAHHIVGHLASVVETIMGTVAFTVSATIKPDDLVVLGQNGKEIGLWAIRATYPTGFNIA